MRGRCSKGSLSSRPMCGVHMTIKAKKTINSVFANLIFCSSIFEDDLASVPNCCNFLREL